MTHFRTSILVLIATLLLAGQTAVAAKREKVPQDSTLVSSKTEKPVSKGLLWFYSLGLKVDRFLLRGVDTAYIGLPEQGWRLAYTNGVIGVNSQLSNIYEVVGAEDLPQIIVTLLNRTRPSVDLGFNAGYRSLAFGYSWDAINAYSRRLNFSFGSKAIGLDFQMQTSSNINSYLLLNGEEMKDFPLPPNIVRITNANLSVWYALNSAHYSHQAAIKQSYIQRKSAGSLLIHLNYMSSQSELGDSSLITAEKVPLLPILMSGMTAIRTRQIAVGIGYGINYTPNKGKVLLHASAAFLVVPYTINLISYQVPDDVGKNLPGTPMYNINASAPVHVTGTVRAAVSWEINRWVHLSAWATGENVRFRSEKTSQNNYLTVSNWNWKVNLTAGVRLGMNNKRARQALGAREYNKLSTLSPLAEQDVIKLPNWFTRWFFSPKL